MEGRSGVQRPESLIVEQGARATIIDGQRVELPPTEFALLAVLASRPGEVVSHKELAAEAFGPNVPIAPHDLHWRMWKLRDLIGDRQRDDKLVENRRGLGYVLDLSPDVVKVVAGVARTATEKPVPLVESPVAMVDEDPRADARPAAPSGHESDTFRDRSSASPAAGLRPAVVLLGVAIAAAALAGSWIAGYQLSQQKDSGKEPVRVSEASPGEKDGRGESHDQNKRSRDDKRRDKNTDAKHNDKRDRSTGPATSAGGRGQNPGYTSTDAPGSDSSVPSATGPATGDQATSSGQSGNTAQATPGDNNQGSSGNGNDPPPPAAQPNAQLYHLFNPDSGDHFMTISSSAANQKQAEGYTMSLEGGVFTSQETGTVAIGLDGATAYVYRDPGSAEGVSVSPLYRLSSADDFFYTTSSSQANQAQAEGWSRSVAGYVST